YWPRAEPLFWDSVHGQRPLEELRRPFAQLAVEALRQAVRPDLARHQRAGAALAQATRTLWQAASPIPSPRPAGARRAQP
ncbi:hypothetical protein, partial [Streptomyces violascens]|uniref:hypothetical protein n=1 Tax=Streptomyces violascens TaxID=67381 RepID=UPI00369F0CDE